MNNISKVWFGVGVIIVIILCFWVADFSPKIYQRWSQQRYVNKLETLKTEYKNDQYGGATPEETLKLFIKAFQTGDLELASKYFIPEKREEYLAKMQNWVKLGKGEEIMISLEKSKILGDLRKDSFVADMGEVDGNNKAVSYVEFVLNQDTQKWKLKNM